MGDLNDDIPAVQNALMQLIEEENRNILVVMTPTAGSSAVPPSLSPWPTALERNKAEKRGTLHLFYICALLLAPGQSMVTTLHSSTDAIAEDSTLLLKRC
jgi:hypothetical protein